MYVTVHAELEFTPSDTDLETLWLEKNPGKEAPDDIEEEDCYHDLVRELCEKAVADVYIGCGNGATGGLLCAGSVEGGTLEWTDHSCEVNG